MSDNVQSTSAQRSAVWLGVTMGDPAGIGPEILIKALAAAPQDGTRYLVLGDPALLRHWIDRLKIPLELVPFTRPHAEGRFFIHNPTGLTMAQPPGAGSPEAARAAMACLEDAARRCLRGELAGMVTAPVNKEAIINAGYDFMGQTEWLSHMAGASRTAMLLMGQDDRDRWLRVVLATTHVPIAKVSSALTREKVELAIDMAARACQLLGLKQARIGVCGLNPHAGEGGKMGGEEIAVITPAVEACRKRGCNAVGPLAADALFHHAFRGDYDIVVAMYHDQGLAPLKMIGFERGINWTVGLPFVRTSPDHGTGYDIAGRGIASPSSMEAALSLARQLTRPA